MKTVTVPLTPQMQSALAELARAKSRLAQASVNAPRQPGSRRAAEEVKPGAPHAEGGENGAGNEKGGTR